MTRASQSAASAWIIVTILLLGSTMARCGVVYPVVGR